MIRRYGYSEYFDLEHVYNQTMMTRSEILEFGNRIFTETSKELGENLKIVYRVESCEKHGFTMLLYLLFVIYLSEFRASFPHQFQFDFDIKTDGLFCKSFEADIKRFAKQECNVVDINLNSPL